MFGIEETKHTCAFVKMWYVSFSMCNQEYVGHFCVIRWKGTGEHLGIIFACRLSMTVQVGVIKVEGDVRSSLL